MIHQEYDIIVPFGRCCHSAMILNDLKLRKCSFPFDWLVDFKDELDDIDIRFELLEDFSSFLRKENVEYFRNRFCEDPYHYLAVDNKWKMALWHDFDVKKSDNQNLIITRFKYQKRHKRLLNIIKKVNKIALVHIVNTHDRIHEYNQKLDIQNIVDNINNLNSKYKDKVFDFYAFEHNANFTKDEIKINCYDTNYKSKVFNIISNHSILNNTNNPMDIISITSILSTLKLTDSINDEDMK